MQTMNMQEIILTAFSKITCEDCQQWIAHCGIQYYVKLKYDIFFTCSLQ